MSGQEDVHELIKQLKSDEVEIRRIAAKKLRKAKDTHAVEPLIMALQDQDEGVRRSVIKTLEIIGDIRAFEPLINLLDDEDSSVRQTVLAALGKLGDARVVDYAEAALQDQSMNVRHMAIKVLRRLRSSDVIEILSDAQEDNEETIRRSAVEGLSEIGGEQVIEPLASALQDDDDDDVRRIAAHALHKIGGEQVVESLASALHDDDEEVRRIAARALREIGGEQVVESLISALQDNDASVKKHAADGLGDVLGGTRNARMALTPLTAMLKNDDFQVRQKAVCALGRIGDPRAIEPLTTALQDDENSVLYTAIQALGWMRDTGGSDSLIALLQEEEAHVRALAAEALGKIGDPRAVEFLAPLLYDEVYDIRRCTRQALQRIGGAQVFAVLADVLVNRPGFVTDALHYWSDTIPGTSKAEYIINNVLVKCDAVVTQVRVSQIFRAMLPSSNGKDQMQKEKDQNELCQTLIRESLNRKADIGLISIIADLLVFGAPGRDKAADSIERYQRENNLLPRDFDILRKYVGGERALEPILAQLQSTLDNHFLEPIDKLNEVTLSRWEDTVKQAKRGFDARLYMSYVVFIFGLVTSIIALYQFLFGDFERIVLFFGPGVALTAGLASIVSTFYFGPLREVQKSVTDLSITHTAFIGYIHSVLEISQTFASLFLQQKMNFSEMEKSRDLIRDAVTHTFGILKPELERDMKVQIPESLEKTS